jgi:hypothetical protein
MRVGLWACWRVHHLPCQEVEQLQLQLQKATKMVSGCGREWAHLSASCYFYPSRRLPCLLALSLSLCLSLSLSVFLSLSLSFSLSLSLSLCSAVWVFGGLFLFLILFLFLFPVPVPVPCPMLSPSHAPVP